MRGIPVICFVILGWTMGLSALPVHPERGPLPQPARTLASDSPVKAPPLISHAVAADFSAHLTGRSRRLAGPLPTTLAVFLVLGFATVTVVVCRRNS